MKCVHHELHMYMNYVHMYSSYDESFLFGCHSFPNQSPHKYVVVLRRGILFYAAKLRPPALSHTFSGPFALMTFAGHYT
jgi:hypothetical protein